MSRDVPSELRVEFEEAGVDVVARICGRPLTVQYGTVGVPEWAADPIKRQHALSWLQEQRKAQRRRDAWQFWLTVAGLVVAVIAAGAAILAAWEGWPKA
jgi:hypothetical protein